MKQTLRRAAPSLAGLTIGLAAFLLVYGPVPLDPTRDDWLLGGYIETDLLQHYAAWLAIKSQGLGWPLTFTTGLNWPSGAAAALADCIPLLAVPFGLLRGLLPGTFQYFGLFVCGSLMLQGEAAVRLLRLFTKRMEWVLGGAVIFCLSPILLERAFRHTALCAHWLILYALWLYFKSAEEGLSLRRAAGFAALAALAAPIHLYFVPMVLAIAFAAGLRALVCTRRWQPFALAAGGGSLAALAVAWALGFFTVSGSADGGYGTFGMNLNALWNPVSLDWNWWVPGCGQLHWSRVLPIRPLVANSLDSFNYLGLGLLAALAGCALAAAWLLARRRAQAKALAKQALSHWPLALVCCALTAFAVSNVVTANSRTLFTLPLPQWLTALCGVFRASGRMFWPVWYLVAALALAALAKLPRRRLAAAALAAVLALQVFDLSGALAQKREWFAEPALRTAAPAPTEEELTLLEDCDTFYTLEVCTDRGLAVALGRAGLATNISLLARGDDSALAAGIETVRAALEAGESEPLGEGVAFYTTDEAFADAVSAASGLRKTPFYQGWALLAP